MAAGERHKLYEDVLAMLLGTMFVALGMVVYATSTLLVGSMAGLALLVQIVTGYGFGLVFFLVNLPFYVLALRRMGWRFTLRTFIAVCLVSLLYRLTAGWIAFAYLNPVYAAILGGALTGVGLLILFRHRTGLGGINILALYLQDTYGWRAGYVQLAFDLTILACAAFVVPPDRLALSIVGATILNGIVAFNHKAGRYRGIS